MRTSTVGYMSSDGVSRIHARTWEPDSSGPVLGMATGLTTPLLGGAYFAYNLAFAPVGIFIGAAVCLLARRGVFRS